MMTQKQVEGVLDDWRSRLVQLEERRTQKYKELYDGFPVYKEILDCERDLNLSRQMVFEIEKILRG